MYQFHRDEESIAWRTVGLAARLCIEIGLHRRETYKSIFNTDEERTSATLLFWSVRVLDQRWSFGTGLPFAMQDADIDPLLQKPDNTTPYLAAMVVYSGIGSRVWQRVANFDATRTKLSNEEVEYLDYQVIQWQRSIPEPLKYIPPGQSDGEQPDSRSNHRLRILLYLRGNQMRINIFRPILHSAASIQENSHHAHTAVDVANETICILTAMNRTTDLYRTQQVMFNYFLISALAVLFLAVSHAPEQFSGRCRDEFYMALDLVRSMTPSSYVSKRLWKTIKGLKEIGPKLGLGNMRNPVDAAADAHSSAAVAMAGLAGHNVDELALFGNGHPSLALGHGDSPNGMANDLTNLFEAVGANGYSMSGVAALQTPNGAYVTAGDANGGEGLGSVFGHQDELSRILRDLF
jgi:Fungal specific transcription factor domain